MRSTRPTFIFPDLLYAVPVEATIANGRIVKLDTAVAEKMPGVKAIFHRGNIGKIVEPGSGRRFRGHLPTNAVRHLKTTSSVTTANTWRWPWPTTFETAKAAADAVRVEYAKEKPNVDTHLKEDDDPEVITTTFGMRKRLQSERGDADAALAKAEVKLDQTYVTPAETHNPLELHATTAIWDGTNLTLYDSSQGVVNFQSVLAQIFGLPKENVRVITKFVGSGFGSKLFPWTHWRWPPPLRGNLASRLGSS